MPQAMPHPLLQIVPVIIICFIFYFLIIKPQKAKSKEHEKTLTNLKKNDQIVTVGGIHATVINVKEKTLVIRIDDNVKIEIDKNAVGRLLKLE
ncbi:MAG: preprotein translocase subunit YajC [Candidatus Omnitrophica bacterium CG11_big_fil_rev_8_21_14_0_20_42_13]|uniref:Sec translocon accessory complex subunit YajC n=1 Tax=Candidatus Ghiorseimicrobium undicola TaxID=1974746 RepID=A0A2H0LVE6_9BACT|nr:MAG: preprotein translocase subunit YajC [Candidatus Omnitrophica bacterium CG11_big_fil_rev_8_21_14_0_20_42_13]